MNDSTIELPEAPKLSPSELWHQQVLSPRIAANAALALEHNREHALDLKWKHRGTEQAYRLAARHARRGSIRQRPDMQMTDLGERIRRAWHQYVSRPKSVRRGAR